MALPEDSPVRHRDGNIPSNWTFYTCLETPGVVQDPIHLGSLGGISFLEGWDYHRVFEVSLLWLGFNPYAGDALLVSEHHAMLPQMWTGRTAAHHPHVPCLHGFLRLVRCFPGKSTENPHVWG